MRSAAAFMLVGFAAALHLHGAHADGMPCKVVEYAQLKDSSRAELHRLYCVATSFANLNAEMEANSRRLFDEQLNMGANTDRAQAEAKSRGASRVQCLQVAESVESMLKKKFKAKPPASCAPKLDP